MTKAMEKAHNFLHQHGMHPADLDMKQELSKFIANMEQGLTGHYTDSDCKMLPAYVASGRQPAVGSRALALDAGGTNLRAALVTFGESGPVIEQLMTRPIPGIGAPISKEQFLKEIAEFSAPVAKQAEHMGFCFSYQADIQPDGDGSVICFSKEVEVLDSAGMLVCRELLDTYKAMNCPAPSRYALVNDTVAALLGGCAIAQGPHDGLLGLILGTGNNVCYQAKTEHIKRPVVGWTGPEMIINMESGVYSGFPQGTFDKEIDQASMSPGSYGNEKMVGGVYQGVVMLHTLRGSGDVFSDEFHVRLSQLSEITSADLSVFAADSKAEGVLAGLCATEEDREALEVIVDCLLERAARLVVLSLAGPMETEDMGKTAPALVVAEGSTFWKNNVLRSKIEAVSRSFLGEVLGRQCTFMKAENPNLIGAAMAALQ